jgi:DNA repair exonuclease SbcCD nuclease subunit
MSDLVKFIVYADIHHASSAASKGLILDDTITIERDVLTRAFEGGFDFTLFAGDRFFKREPEDEVKVKADRLFYELYPNYKPHYHLIGNHDWTDNTRRWHTAESMKSMPNIYVMDQAKTYQFSDSVLIHALPADFTFDMGKYVTDPSKLNLFVFHDTVVGSYLSEDFEKTIGSGIEVGSIDRSEFDMVFAGDIHIPQTFPFKNTMGGYVGAILQRTRADSNREDRKSVV